METIEQKSASKTKVCYTCKKEKNINLFGVRSSSKDGYHYYCKSCARELKKDWRSGKRLRTTPNITKPPKEELARLYETMTQAEIARYYNCSQASIGNWLLKDGLKTEINKCDRSELDKNLIIDLYCEQKKSVNEISKIIVSSRTKIIDFLKRNGIERRSKKENWRWKEEWNGYEEINGSFWNRVVRGAKNRKLEISIDAKYAYEIFIKQGRRCALTGDLLTMSSVVRYSNQQTASLDRIDSSKGYVPGNVQWVHKRVNIMKLDSSEDELYDWCKKIVDYREEYLSLRGL